MDLLLPKCPTSFYNQPIDNDMIFCDNCFKDLEIKAIITAQAHRGKCPICGADSYLYDTDRDTNLDGIFDKVISVYTPEQDLPKTFPPEELGSLAERITLDWDIFNSVPGETIQEILSVMASGLKEDIPELFSGRVGIAEKYDEEYLRGHSILRTDKWSNFVDTIKHKNRFHVDLIDTDILKKLCFIMQKDITIGKQRYYRGRIARNSKGFSPRGMGAPPKEIATAGRANAAGISRLYLTNNMETTLHEIRAAEFDYVTIGTFKLLEPIKVVDLSQIARLSPFATESDEFDCTALAINKEHLNKINQEMSRIMRRGDSPLDYIPTQYICDFVMSITDENGIPVFDGIEYQSTVYGEGANLTIFYPDKFKCTYTRTFEVTKLQYRKRLATVSNKC